ncbi:MAG: Holliday junction branch migration protein RuvA [Proteobacteria bacterium]|nr:Holliday junction branch migration protein RuvA [Pseudomonadota bacterium]
MIGRLRGLIETQGDDTVIVDAGGVGYLVYVSAHTLRKLPQDGGASQLFIETHVREDHIHLFGFFEAEEQECFRMLTTVNGVGNKVGIAILSVLTPAQVMTAIAAQDKNAFRQVSGVGPKLAERIVVELKDKAKGIALVAPTTSKGGKVATGEHAAVSDAISALINLGYNRSDAYTAVQRAAREKGVDKVDDLIRFGLKELAS